jgi:HEAT repeat protein
MHKRTGRRYRLLGWTAIPVLLGWATAFGAPPPVEELRQVLRDPSQDAVLRETRLRQCLPALVNLDDLRAALALREWNDTDPDEQRAAVDRAVRKILAQRFERMAHQLLWHGDTAVRRAVLDMLADMGIVVRAVQGTSGLARDLAPDLAQLVERGPSDLRAPAARALGLINPDPVIAAPALRKLLESGADAERQAAAGAIQQWLQQTAQLALRRPNLGGARATEADWAQVGSALLPALGHGLRDQRTEVRRLCAAAISEAAHTLDDLLPDPQLTEPAKSGRQDEYLTELRPVIGALREQLPILTKTLGDADSEVRVRVRQALQDMAGAQARLLVLAKKAPQGKEGGATSALQPVVYHPDTPTAADPMAAGLQGTIQALVVGLEDRDVTVRRATLDALEALGPAAALALPALIKALDDPDRFVRWTAARTLGKISPAGADRAVPALARLLKDSDLDLRLTATAALERYGSAAASVVPLLIESLAAPDAEERVASLRVLAGIGPAAKTAVVPITALLRDPDERVRRAAAQGLGQLGSRGATVVEALVRALEDPDPEVRQAVDEALVRIRKE